MKWLLFFLCIAHPLFADVAIDVQYDKKPITIDEKLVLNVTLSYPPETPPNLFPFMYRLLNKNVASFKLVNFDVVDAKHFRLVLEPTHTGSLIFAPGPISFGHKRYLFPPIAIECLPASISTLPLARLLPLYPEKRIDLSIKNRTAMISEAAMQRIQAENQKAYNKMTFARSALAITVTALAFSMLMLWLVIYYEVSWRMLRLQRPKLSPLQSALKQLKASSKAFQWQALAYIIREALGKKEAKNFHQKSLFELADYVEISASFKDREKKELLPLLNLLGAISYAGQKVDEDEWMRMRKKVLDLVHSLVIR